MINMRDSTDLVLTFALLLLCSVFTLSTLVSYERNTTMLEESVCDKQSTIDSLTNVIDSLEHKLNTFNIKHQYKEIKREFKDILDAIIFVESSYNDSAYCASEDAVGCLQIRQCMVDDINRILTKRGSSSLYSYSDRWDRDKSTQMFTIYCKYYKLNGAEEMARCWNGGPRGVNNPATQRYWNKVETKIEEAYALR
tara:strand:- start:347 stop:934 length:588 start_codon:yes stop_codon:yes gene_type:complete